MSSHIFSNAFLIFSAIFALPSKHVSPYFATTAAMSFVRPHAALAIEVPFTLEEDTLRLWRVLAHEGVPGGDFIERIRLCDIEQNRCTLHLTLV